MYILHGIAMNEGYLISISVKCFLSLVFPYHITLKFSILEK